MHKFFWLKLVVAVLTVCGVHDVAAQEQGALLVEPFSFAEDFERGEDPVQFWTSYNKKHTVHFKGVTDEKAYSGKRSFKLDVTFDETSRFLWRIPMTQQVPVAGMLAFSGRMFLGEGTTGRATLGVSFRFPPSRHKGCTSPYAFHESTCGKWQAVGGDFVNRGRDVADAVMSRFEGSQGDLVGIYLEQIIIDLRGEAGKKVVLYVDDLEIRGDVPTKAAYEGEMERRKAVVKKLFDAAVVSWGKALGETKQTLLAITGLVPKADARRKVALGKIAEHDDILAAMKAKGAFSGSEQSVMDRFIDKSRNFATSVKALSDAALTGRHAVVYVVPPVSAIQILPGDPFVHGKISQQIAMQAAHGEYEPASFVVSALSGIKSLKVAVGTLRGERGVIPSANVDVKVVKCWYQAGTAWEGIRQDKSKRILTPELLLNDDQLVKLDHDKHENFLKLSFPDGEKYVWISDSANVYKGKSLPVEKFPIKDSPKLLPVDIPADTNKQFWVTVRIPEDAPAGTYTGTIRLQTPDAVIAELALSVNVLPFDLLPPYYTSSMDYHGRLMSGSMGTIGSWGKSREQFTNELANMVAHGLHNCQHYSIRKEILGDVLRIRAEVGMDNRTLYLKNTIRIGNPTAPEELARIKRDVRDIIEFTKAYGTEVVYFYGMDERRGEMLRSQRPAWQAVREAGGKIFVAGYDGNIDMMGDIQDMHVRAGSPSKEEVAKWHALGHKIFSYANPQTGVENPLVYRRNFGLLLWKYDYDGAATNAYQHTFGATWNDFDHVTYRAHTIAYPTMNGVVDTIAWEGYREGVDDVRYVTTLETAIGQARKTQDHTRKRNATAAEHYLRQLKAGGEIETDDLDAIRREIITHIINTRGGSAKAR
ncbi:MAG: hypothetical protein KAI66_08865 [Lentisphaeria bacterium]|nr:hypothetical protein [Lentisphaeria bacterium]